jgi:thioredoxin reductase (NADPH)
VHGLDQISHAMGEGGVAATTIHNDLFAKEPRWRPNAQQLVDAEGGS